MGDMVCENGVCRMRDLDEAMEDDFKRILAKIKAAQEENKEN